jgi:citrate synthase
MGSERSRRLANPAAVSSDDGWKTAITRIEPNKILVRGYPLDEMMGRVGFADAIYLLLMGELPPPAISRLITAILVSSVDHGAMPPSTLVARNVATTGAPLRAAVAAGVLGFGSYHGGDVEACMQMLDAGLAVRREGGGYDDAAEHVVHGLLRQGKRVPGFGHRLHTRDPRADKLLQMAYELDLEGEHIRLLRVIERVLGKIKRTEGDPIPINVDGAISAICGDIGLDYEFGSALFIISRVPGLIAHAHEERLRERPMRQIDPKDAIYDGPAERRLPEGRKQSL